MCKTGHPIVGGLSPVLDLDLLQFNGVNVLLHKCHIILTEELLDEVIEFLMDIVSLVLHVVVSTGTWS